MDITYNVFFPTIVANVQNKDHDSISLKLVKHCLEIQQKTPSGGEGWISNQTYNTSNGRHEIFYDDVFKELNEWVINNVHKYCKHLNINTEKLNNSGSWFNIYKKYNYQEKHVHPNSIISCIYILCAPSNTAKIHLLSPLNDMFHVNYLEHNQNNTRDISCESKPGMLLIFPSYLPHSVARYDSEDLRISLSYNFKQYD